MKLALCLIPLFLMACYTASPQVPNSESPQLWLLTARITTNSTFQRDTTKSFDAGGKNWSEEKHQSGKITASGVISVIIENQAENLEKDFLFDSGAGDPVSMTVSGSGSRSEISSYQETIDGKLISADNGTIDVSGTASPGASVFFSYSDDNKFVEVSIPINGSASQKGRHFYDEWKDYSSEYDYNIPCSGGADTSSDKNCHITKTGKGYQASWKERESKRRSTVDGTEFTISETTLEVTIVPYKESDKPVVTIDGCKDLGTGETGNATATAKPEGGSFKFWVEPSDLMAVVASDAVATLTGQTPGRGTLMVEYTSPEGKIAQSSSEASCVKVESYNGGEKMPQIALYDINGKKQSGIKTIPVKALPENASELVKFEPANPSILSAVGVGSEVTLQGLQEGKTTLQAKTKCGGTTGPTVEVEVVNCDDETKAKLAEMMKIAQENQKEAMEQIEKISDSEEYKEAAEDITKSTLELAEKTALTIAAGGKTSGGLHEALEITEAVATMKDLLTSQTAENLNFNELTALAKVTGAKALKAVAGVSEVMKAANEFGHNLGKLMGTEIELKGAIERAENANKQVIEVVRLQKICRSSEQPQGKEGPQNEPTAKTDQPKSTTEPKTSSEQPPASEPQTQDHGTQEPTSGQTADDGTEVSPPPPTSEPKQVGLPFEPASCGCNNQKGVELSAEGFSALQTGMENLGKCVTDFISGSATNYMTSLNELQSLTVILETASKSGTEVFKKTSGEAIPKLDGILGSTKSYEKSGNDFYNGFKECPESMKSGLEVIGSAKEMKGTLIESK